MILFRDYSTVVLGIDCPDVRTRDELRKLIGDNADAVWTEYVKWHCSIRSVDRGMTFSAWLRTLDRYDCTYEEWCFVSDVQADKDFPHIRAGSGLDLAFIYLSDIGAVPATFNALETLWIKFHYGT